MTNERYAHLGESEVENFLEGKLKNDEMRYVICHLKKCSECFLTLQKAKKKIFNTEKETV